MISLVVPTYNRPDFAVRTLSYYAAVAFRGEILVGDSSAGASADRTRRAVEELSSRLRVRYFDCRGIDDRLTLHRLSTLVRTKYAVFIGDDDLLFPSGIDQCVSFLEGHPEFAAANGSAWAFRLSAPGAYGRLRIVDEYPQPDLPQDAPLQRLQAHLSDYRVTLFSVHRADVWRAMWARVPEISDRAFSAELLPCCLSPVLGRIKHMDVPYLLRQTHASRYDLPAFANWLAKPDWQASHDKFCAIVGEHLAAGDSPATDSGASVVGRLFSHHYLRRFARATAVPPGPLRPGPFDSARAAIYRAIHNVRAHIKWNAYSRRLLRRWSHEAEPFRSDYLTMRRIMSAPSAAGRALHA